METLLLAKRLTTRRLGKDHGEDNKKTTGKLQEDDRMTLGRRPEDDRKSTRKQQEDDRRTNIGRQGNRNTRRLREDYGDDNSKTAIK